MARPVQRIEVFAEAGEPHELDRAGRDLVGQCVPAVLTETVPQQPVRVQPDRAAPVALRIEAFGALVEGGHQVVETFTRVERWRLELTADRRHDRPR